MAVLKRLTRLRWQGCQLWYTVGAAYAERAAGSLISEIFVAYKQEIIPLVKEGYRLRCA